MKREKVKMNLAVSIGHLYREFACCLVHRIFTAGKNRFVFSTKTEVASIIGTTIATASWSISAALV